jgi:[protein-PII] uridylyltransferase
MMPPMPDNEKTLANAAKLLKWDQSEADPAETARTLRRFLKIETRRLKLTHQSATPGHRAAQAFSSIVDIVVKHAFAHANRAFQAHRTDDAPPDGCAVVAIGGYGRGELAPYSDIDILFLFSNRRLAEMKVVSAGLLRLLWDAGLTVGHSFRTVGDAVTSALDDPHFRTALVDTRLLVGSRAMHTSLQDALEKDRRRRTKRFVEAIASEREARHIKFGAVVCLQEPNVKESAGGLRDYQTALWLAHARYGYKHLDELRAHNLVTEIETRRIKRAHDFLWRVRNSAHSLTSRKTERLSLELQAGIAKHFGYRASLHSLASEKFMRDYYRHARELYLFNDAVQARVVDNEQRSPRWWHKQPSREPRELFSIRRGRLQLDGDADVFTKQPLIIFNAFQIAQAARVPFGFQLRETLAQSVRGINAAFRGSDETVSAFLKLLRRRGRVGYILRLMHDVGFLARLIPEFGRVSLLVQHDLYHHFTVDEHSLKAVDFLDELHVSTNKHQAAMRAIFEELEDPTLLYLAVLLHDIGKGKGRGHIARGARLAERVCRRLRLKEADVKRVVWLVRQHVAMAHLAQRRDLTEAGLIAAFASEIESLEALNMLLLLTYADTNAVGPGVWTDWKASLLWDLYGRTRKSLTGSTAPIEDYEGLVQFKQQIAKASDPLLPASEVERHLALLPDRYWRIHTPEAAMLHMRMVEEVRTENFAVHWVHASRSCTELTFCARDRHGLFADLAGTLAGHGIEILQAELNTREDGIIIDEFTLRQASTGLAVEERRCLAVEQALRKAAGGTIEVAGMVERWRSHHAPRKKPAVISPRRQLLPLVACDNEGSASATLVEVHAIDETGLAYKIASAFAALGLEIICARIATERSDALDVFYVNDSNGNKLSEELIRSVEREITRKLINDDSIKVQPGLKKPEERRINEESRSDHSAASA